MTGTGLALAAAVCAVLAVSIRQPAGQPYAGPAPRPSATPTHVTSRTASPSPVTETSRTSVTASSAPVNIVSPILPAHLRIPAIGVSAAVAPGKSAVEYDPHTGQQSLAFPVPPNLEDVTWWQGGPNPSEHITFAPAPKPGGQGIAILTMHSSLGGVGYGVGNHLGQLRLGQLINVTGWDTGAHQLRLTFAVIGKQQHLDKANPGALSAAIRQAPAGTRLVLVTCSGSVNYTISSSNFNTVVYATLKSSARV